MTGIQRKVTGARTRVIAGAPWRFCSALVVLLVAGWSVAQVPPDSPPPLSRFVPDSPLLVLESKDFASLVRDWNTSQEKRLWLTSDNYAVFSRSKLFLRLNSAQQEFAAAGGIPPNMALLESVAGAESVLALYDIGNLEFLYLARMPSARTFENMLWQTRASFEPRNVAGQAYYVKTDAESRRVVAFAATDDYLLLATREDLLARALRLLSGEQEGTPVSNEPWYADAVTAGGTQGNPRLVLHMEALVRSPHFRSYWIQGNVSDLRQYRAAVCDIRRSPGQVREERVLLRSGETDRETAPSLDTAAVEALAGLAGDSAGLYRIWAQPGVDRTIRILKDSLLAPETGFAPPSDIAPRVYMTQGTVGSEAALETLIDQPPPAQNAGAFEPALLRTVIERHDIQALLHLQSSTQENVFVGSESSVVLAAASDWDADAALDGLRAAVDGLWTTSRPGVGWVAQDDGAYFTLDGLTRLQVAFRGRLLLVSNSIRMLEELLVRTAAPAAGERASFLAGFQHTRERENYARLMRHLDYLQINRFGSSTDRQPAFFSENLASLSNTLRRVRAMTVHIDDAGETLSQVVTYHLE